MLPYAGQFGQHMVACLIGSISQNYSSSPSYITESADNVTINRNLIITGISWYGQYLGSVSTSYLSFRIRIYEDINGYPELKPFFEGWASPDFVQVNNDNSKPTFKFTAPLIFNPVSLFSGHKYWISIIDNNEMFPTYRWCGSTPEIGDGFVSRAQNFTTGIWKNYPSYSTENLSLQLFTRESPPIRSNAVKILLNMKQIESEQHNNR